MSRVKLTDVCDITTGKLDANAAETGGKYPYFTCAPEPLTINTYAFDDDVILLAGNNAAGNFHCQRYKGKFNAYQRTYVITAKAGYDIDYIYYSLKIKLKLLKKKAQGSQTKFLTMQILEGFQIEDIDKTQQKNLASVLSFIDKKILDNKKINAELEGMAKTIYDYWFLQFDFPNKDGKPYKSSGGKMVWNEELRREIPERWYFRKLSDISNIELNSISPQKDKIYRHYSIPAYDESRMPVLEKGESISSNKYIVPNDAILVSKLNPQFKRLWLLQENVIDGICSTEFMPFISVVDNKEFLFAVLNSDGFYKFMVQSSSSSTGSRKRMQPELMGEYSFAYPCDSNVLSMFKSVIQPNLEEMIRIREENQELMQLRDFLLPLLMNGQVGFK